MKFAFVLSDHGFGHLMRNLPVVEYLLQQGQQIILICGQRQLQAAEEYLAGYGKAVSYLSLHTDAGLVVQPGSLKIDIAATTKAVAQHVEQWSQLQTALKQLDMDRMVVDIAPWALPAAREKGIPCYLMASFTWLEQYAWFLPQELYTQYESAFRAADRVLLYGLANQPTRRLYPHGIEVGMVCRQQSSAAAAAIRKQHTRPIVFLSLGASNSGLDMTIDVQDLPYDFITTSALHLVGDNVTVLPSEVPNTQDYMLAADYAIAKAGWGTIAEMLIAGTKGALLERQDTPEDTMLIEQLGASGEVLAIKPEELQNMAAVLQKLESYDFQPRSYSNNYAKIGELLLE